MASTANSARNTLAEEVRAFTAQVESYEDRCQLLESVAQDYAQETATNMAKVEKALSLAQKAILQVPD